MRIRQRNIIEHVENILTKIYILSYLLGAGSKIYVKKRSKTYRRAKSIFIKNLDFCLFVSQRASLNFAIFLVTASKSGCPINNSRKGLSMLIILRPFQFPHTKETYFIIRNFLIHTYIKTLTFIDNKHSSQISWIKLTCCNHCVVFIIPTCSLLRHVQFHVMPYILMFFIVTCCILFAAVYCNKSVMMKKIRSNCTYHTLTYFYQISSG